MLLPLFTSGGRHNLHIYVFPHVFGTVWDKLKIIFSGDFLKASELIAAAEVFVVVAI